MKVIMIRPSYDNVTRTLNSWAASAKGSISLDLSDDLNGELATETNLRTSLQVNPPVEMVAFYGHGDVDHLIGHGRGPSGLRPVVHKGGPGVLPNELPGRNLYAVACWSGAELGPALATAGCRFVGYCENFSYVEGFEDFKNVVNRGLIEWATKEKTNAEIHAQVKDDWAALRRRFSIADRKGEKNAFMAALCALWNHECVCTF